MKRRRAPRSGGTDQDLHQATWSLDCLRRMDDEFVVAVEVAFRLGLEDPDAAARTYASTIQSQKGGRAVNNRSVDVLVWEGTETILPPLRRALPHH